MKPLFVFAVALALLGSACSDKRDAPGKQSQQRGSASSQGGGPNQDASGKR